jgi:N-acetylmuramoyl-L-alanine amidase
MRTSISRQILGSVVLLVAGACGTAGSGVAVEQPRPTIFPEEEAEPVTSEQPETSTTTTTTTLPLSQRLPELVDDGRARVVVTPTEIVVPVLGETEAGWLVRTPCGDEAQITTGTPVVSAHVVIDAGHGGSEVGAVGESGTHESDLNLAVAQMVAAELRSQGVEVVLTRTTDTRSTLATRAEIATSLRADAFVSIHHNADPDGPSTGPGTETWYQIDDPESRRLSGLIYEEVVEVLARHEVGWVADTDAGVKYRLNQRGTDYYGILRNATGVPTSLAELAYLSNPEEEQLLVRPEIQALEAEAVAAGIVRFLGTDDPGSGFVEPYERVEPAGPGGGTAGCEDPALE